MPDWRFEKAEGGPKGLLVAGVDEAGRGPAAGPVIAAAVILERRGAPKGLDDSKALSRAQRERLFEALMTAAAKGKALIAWGAAEPEEIDRANILEATMRAMGRAVALLPERPDVALIDGDRAPRLVCRTRTIVQGDALSISIAAASIVAKVIRDRLMEEAHERWPVYGFARHAGYPTEDHRAALLAHGPCPIHRRSWAPVRECLRVRLETRAA
jgi:ribonuclease HII